jgi:hypothetical protein
MGRQFSDIDRDWPFTEVLQVFGLLSNTNLIISHNQTKLLDVGVVAKSQPTFDTVRSQPCLLTGPVKLYHFEKTPISGARGTGAPQFGRGQQPVCIRNAVKMTVKTTLAPG